MVGLGLKSEAKGEFKSPAVPFALPQADTTDAEPDADDQPDTPEEEEKALALRTKTGAKTETGICVAFWLNSIDAEALAVEGGEPAEVLHMTLAFLGEIDDQGADRGALSDALAAFAADHEPITGRISGTGTFKTPDGDAVVALIDAPALSQWWQELVETIEAAGLTVSRDHGFTPHTTLAYVDPGQGTASRHRLATSWPGTPSPWPGVASTQHSRWSSRRKPRSRAASQMACAPAR